MNDYCSPALPAGGALHCATLSHFRDGINAAYSLCSHSVLATLAAERLLRLLEPVAGCSGYQCLCALVQPLAPVKSWSALQDGCRQPAGLATEHSLLTRAHRLRSLGERRPLPLSVCATSSGAPGTTWSVRSYYLLRDISISVGIAKRS
jgi:hypothetical protein